MSAFVKYKGFRGLHCRLESDKGVTTSIFSGGPCSTLTGRPSKSQRSAGGTFSRVNEPQQHLDTRLSSTKPMRKHLATCCAHSQRGALKYFLALIFLLNAFLIISSPVLKIDCIHNGNQGRGSKTAPVVGKSMCRATKSANLSLTCSYPPN